LIVGNLVKDSLGSLLQSNSKRKKVAELRAQQKDLYKDYQKLDRLPHDWFFTLLKLSIGIEIEKLEKKLRKIEKT
jgi:hypothetical protein